jgi:hypothetical protein
MFKNKDGSRWVFDPDYKEMFGLERKAKWPAAGFDPRLIQGIMCWVTPEPSIVVGLKPGSFYMRAYCHCPVCGKTFTMSRLRQHAKVVHPLTLAVRHQGED